MRVPISAGLAGVALCCLAGCGKPAPASSASASAPAAAPTASAPSPLTAATLPHRKPGLWRQTMTMEGMNMPMPVTQMCLDAASEAKMSMFGQNMRRGHCDSESFSRNLDGSISYSSSCDFGGSKTESHGTVSGDFNSSYTVVVDTKSQGGDARKMTMTATWIGPCAPGQKGGDVVMPDGKVMNFTQ
jgi:hypothetical protein